MGFIDGDGDFNLSIAAQRSTNACVKIVQKSPEILKFYQKHLLQKSDCFKDLVIYSRRFLDKRSSKSFIGHLLIFGRNSMLKLVSMIQTEDFWVESHKDSFKLIKIILNFQSLYLLPRTGALTRTKEGKQIKLWSSRRFGLIVYLYLHFLYVYRPESTTIVRLFKQFHCQQAWSVKTWNQNHFQLLAHYFGDSPDTPFVGEEIPPPLSKAISFPGCFLQALIKLNHFINIFKLAWTLYYSLIV